MFSASFIKIVLDKVFMKKLSFYSILLSLIVISCSSNNTSTNTDSFDIKKDTALSSTPTEPEDSTFDSYGFYYPIDTIVFKNYRFSTLSIATTAVNDTGNTKAINVTDVSAILKRVKDDKIKALTFKNFIVKKNKIDLNIIDSEIGNFSLKGRFTVDKSPSQENPASNAVVLKATLKVNEEPAKEVSFTWFSGD